MISVIISTYNSEKYINGCLRAVCGSMGVEFEVIVVDAGSNTRQKLKHLGGQTKKLKNIFLSENVGLTVSHNRGAKEAKGDLLLFLDVDTRIDKNCLFEIEKFFEKHKDAGVVQGKIEATGHFLSIFGFPWEQDNRITGNSEQSRIIFGARTACMAVRKEVFEKVGGFDEDYFMHGEETDLSWRIWLAGYKIYYLPKAKVLHYGKSHYKDKMTGGQDNSEQSEKAHNRLFYEGAKNQITTILKDAPLSIIIWMLPLNILCWMAIGIKSPWVYRGVGRAFLDLKKTMKKRKKIKRINETETREIMFGNIGFFDLVKKGFVWIKSV